MAYEDPAAEVEPVTDPAPEIVEGGEEAPPTGEAPPSTTTEEAPDWGTRITEWGGEERIGDALAIYESLATDEGITSLFIEAGRSLGLGDEAIRGLFGQGAEPAPGPDDDDLDTVLTKREALELLEQKVLEPQAEAARREAEEAHAEHVRSTIHSTLDALEVVDDDDIRMSVLQISNRFLPTDRDPTDADIEKAIKQGVETFQAKIGEEAAKRLAEKREVRDAQPKVVTGGGGGAGEPVEPPTFEKFGSNVLDEAIKRARKQILRG